MNEKVSETYRCFSRFSSRLSFLAQVCAHPRTMPATENNMDRSFSLASTWTGNSENLRSKLLETFIISVGQTCISCRTYGTSGLYDTFSSFGLKVCYCSRVVLDPKLQNAEHRLEAVPSILRCSRARGCCSAKAQSADIQHQGFAKPVTAAFECNTHHRAVKNIFWCHGTEENSKRSTSLAWTSCCGRAAT